MFEETVGLPPALQTGSPNCESGPTDSTVLITGETGTGKEPIARAIHGTRNVQPGVYQLNCASTPSSLIVGAV
jgi:transcriptional regulator with GAF, ATPase, and Fis domain